MEITCYPKYLDQHGVATPCFDHLTKMSPVVKVAKQNYGELVKIFRGRPRIPHRRGHQPSGGGDQHTILQNFPKKMHEFEKILGHWVSICWRHPPRSITGNV